MYVKVYPLLVAGKCVHYASRVLLLLMGPAHSIITLAAKLLEAVWVKPF